MNRDFRGKSLPGEVVEHAADDSITQIIAPFENLGQERARGIDFGLQYELQTAFGTFSSLTQATWLESFRIANTQIGPTLENRSRGVGGGARDAYLKWKGRSRLDWAWKGFDVSATVTYTDGFHEKLFFATDPNTGLKKEHWVHQTFVFDVQGSYEFKFAPPVEAAPVAGYSKGEKEAGRGPDSEGNGTEGTANFSLPCWKKCINNTTITVGCNNVFGQDPPLAFLSAANYPVPSTIRSGALFTSA